jgi:hypothetical protein
MSYLAGLQGDLAQHEMYIYIYILILLAQAAMHINPFIE